MSQSRALGARQTPSSRMTPGRVATGTLAAATLPAIIVSGLGAAAPAVAAPAPAAHPMAPKPATSAHIAAAQARISAHLVAAHVPTKLAPVTAAKTGSVTVKSGDTLSHIAAHAGVSLSSLLKANGLSASSTIYPGQKIALPGGSATSAVKTSASPTRSYTVVSGDTLYGIAARHSMSISRLMRLNGLSLSSIIYPGQKLTVAGSGATQGGTTAPASTSAAATSTSASYTIKSGDTLIGIAARHDMSLSRLLRLNGLSASDTIYPGRKLRVSGGSAAPTSTGTTAQSSSAAAAKTHTVSSGETLSGIAGKYGVGLSKVLAANNLSASSIIYPGQKLSIPGGGSTTTASTQLVPSTFLHYKYPEATVKSANENKAALLAANLPSREEMKSKIIATAKQLGVDPRLALAHAYQESGFSPSAVSPANAIGAMQVIPSSGEWASQLVGRELNLLNPDDNVLAGVAIIASLQRTSDSLEEGIASYYQGQGSVRRNGMYEDTKDYVNSVKAHMAKF